MRRVVPGIFVALLLAALPLHAQVGAGINGQAIGPTGLPVPHALVTVCSYTASGKPCSPPQQIYQDVNLTIPLTQPYATDQYGNYTVFVTPGTYLVQVEVAPGIYYSSTVTANASGAGNLSGSGTVGFLSQWTPNTTTLGNSLADYGVTTANVFNFPAPVESSGATVVPLWNDIRAHADAGYGPDVGGWCDGGDDTAAFNRTVAAIMAGSTATMKMVLPAGTCRVSGVTVGNSSGSIFGFHLEGQGYNYGAPGASTVGTTLLYTGTSGGTVLEFENCEWCSATQLTIDGNNLAGRGFQVLSDPGYSGQHSTWDKLVVRNVSQSPEYDLDVGGVDSTSLEPGDISSNHFYDITVWPSVSGTGIHQFGSQTVTNYYDYIDFRAPNSTTPNQPVIGFHAEEGDVRISHSNWITNGQTYDIMLEPQVYWFSEDKDYHEQGAPPAGATTRPPVWSMWGNVATSAGSGASATVSTSGTTVTLSQVNTVPLYGEDFYNIPNDGTGTVHINGVQYTVASGSIVAPYNTLTLTTSAGSQTNVTLVIDNPLHGVTFYPRNIANTRLDWGSSNGNGDALFMYQQSSLQLDSVTFDGGGTPTISATIPGGSGVETFDSTNSYLNAIPVTLSGFSRTHVNGVLTGYTLNSATINTPVINDPNIVGNSSTGMANFQGTTPGGGTVQIQDNSSGTPVNVGYWGYGNLFGSGEPTSTIGMRGTGSVCLSNDVACDFRVSSAGLNYYQSGTSVWHISPAGTETVSTVSLINGAYNSLLTSLASAASESVKIPDCPSGCTLATAAELPATIAIRAGTWSITSPATTDAITFSTAMSAAPTSCTYAFNLDVSTIAPGELWFTSLATTGATINVHAAPSSPISGTYQCVVNNAN